MGKATPLFGTFWTDRHTRRMTPTEQLLFIFFTTFDAPSSGVSGVYRVMLEDVAMFTNISKRDVTESIRRGIHNIYYDMKTDTVFVKHKLKYRLGGRPDLVELSIAGDYKLTSDASSLWSLFKGTYASFVERSPRLSTLLSDVKPSGNGSTTLLQLEERVDASKKARHQNIGDKIEQLLARYKRELTEEDFAKFTEVWTHLTTDMRNNGPLPDRKRLKLAERMSSEPLLKIARACVEFIESGCIESRKRENYFFGIVRGSATTWYADFKNERDKKAFTLSVPLQQDEGGVVI